MCIPGIGRLLQEVHKKFCKDSKTINLTHQAASKVQMDFRTSRSLHEAKGFYHTGTNKKYIIYTDTSDDTCRAQLSQEHDCTEFPIAFLSHTFTETQRKWSMTEQEAYGVYYAINQMELLPSRHRHHCQE